MNMALPEFAFTRQQLRAQGVDKATREEYENVLAELFNPTVLYHTAYLSFMNTLTDSMRQKLGVSLGSDFRSDNEGRRLGHADKIVNDKKAKYITERLTQMGIYSKSQVRVKRVPGGFNFAIPFMDFRGGFWQLLTQGLGQNANYNPQRIVLNEVIRVLTNTDSFSYISREQEEANTAQAQAKILSFVNEFFGPQFFQYRKPYLHVVPATVKLTKTDYFDPSVLNYDESDLDSANRISASVSGFTITAQPMTHLPYSIQSKLTTTVDGKTTYQDIDSKMSAEQQHFIKYELVGHRDFLVHVNLFVPDNLATYITTRQTASDIPLHQLGSYISHWASADVLGEEAGIDRNTTLSQVRDSNQYGNSSRQRKLTNKEDLLTTTTGRLVYVPNDVDTIAEYEQMLSTFMDGDEFVMNNVSRDPGVKQPMLGTDTPHFPSRPKMVNKLLYVDWFNAKLAYTDTSGLMSVEDLEGSRPTTMSHIYNNLQRPVTADTVWSNDIRGNLEFSLRRILPSVSLSTYMNVFDTLVPPNTESYYADVIRKNCINALAAGLKGYVTTVLRYANSCWVRVSDKPELAAQYAVAEQLAGLTDANEVTFSMFNPKSEIPQFALVGTLLEKAYMLFNANQTEYFAARSVLNGCYEVGILKALVSYDYKSVVKAHKQKVLEYSKTPVLRGTTPQPCAFVNEEQFAFMPHQFKTDKLLEGNPPESIIHTDAGGGKTLSIARDVIRHIEDGSSVNPVILCPGFLISNYIEDFAFLTQGRINVFPISSDSYSSQASGEDRLDLLENALKSKPRNTVIVVANDFLSRGSRQPVSYGNVTVFASPNAMLLQAINIDALWIDESHKLKNLDANVTQEALKLIPGLKFIRIATGTFISDTLVDASGQMALLDPTVFGSRTDFEEEFGNKVVGFTEQAKTQVIARVRQNSQYIRCDRKEWAALLPPRKWRFIPVDLTPDQQKAYDAVLKQTLDEIKSDSNLMDKLRKLKESGDDEESAIDMAGLLQAYLQRLEMFTSAPNEDRDGKKLLKHADVKQSPKVDKVIELIREHREKQIPGKILVFCSYHSTANAIFDALPPEIKKHAIPYKATEKESAKALFERDPNKWVMVGIEKSLGTGLNLQMASRIIRVESVWSPGELEQAMSRIFRPDPKKKYGERPMVYFDWIVADRTIDVTKTARLISKLLWNTLAFDERDNPRYQKLELLDVVSMTLDSIETYNTFNTTDPDRVPLTSYLTQLNAISKIENEEIEEYRRDQNNILEYVNVKRGPDIPNSKIMSNLPFVKDMRLPFMDKLGLVPYQDYAAAQDEHNPDSLRDYDATGLSVWTEFGRCKVVKSAGTKLQLLDEQGIKRTGVDKLSVLVITKPEVNIAKEYQQLVGLPMDKRPKVQPKQTFMEEPVKEEVKRTGRRKDVPIPTEDVVENASAELLLYNINGLYSILVSTDDPDVEQHGSDFVNLGFKKARPFLYVHLETRKVANLFMEKLEDLAARTTNPIIIKSQYLNAVRNAIAGFARGPKGLYNAEGINYEDYRNFYRMAFKPAADNELRPYPMIENGELFIMFDYATQPLARKLPRMISIPGVAWKKEDSGSYMYFTNKKSDVPTVVKQVQKFLTVENLDEIKESYRQLNIKPPKTK